MTALIIWDEVPMQNKFYFEAIDRTLRDVCDKDVLFGGIPVVLGGDFAQIPPVIRNGNRSHTVQSSIQQSFIWEKVTVIHLRQNMRISGTSSNDMHFKDWLCQITYNETLQNKMISLPTYIRQTHSLNDLISRMYPQQFLERVVENPSMFYKSAILTTKNETVDLLNQKVLDLMLGESVTLCSADSADTALAANTSKKNIRRYNAAFAFTSLTCDTPYLNEGNMPFQIHGQMYHTQGSLPVNDPSKAKYAQLYIYDPDFAASVRSSNNSRLDDREKLDDTVISNLSSML
jgi:hypothetical protein